MLEFKFTLEYKYETVAKIEGLGRYCEVNKDGALIVESETIAEEVMGPFADEIKNSFGTHLDSIHIDRGRLIFAPYDKFRIDGDDIYFDVQVNVANITKL